MREIAGKFAAAAEWEKQNEGLSAFEELPEGEAPEGGKFIATIAEVPGF
jgi:hypothetical protein